MRLVGVPTRRLLVLRRSARVPTVADLRGLSNSAPCGPGLAVIAVRSCDRPRPLVPSGGPVRPGPLSSLPGGFRRRFRVLALTGKNITVRRGVVKPLRSPPFTLRNWVPAGQGPLCSTGKALVHPNVTHVERGVTGPYRQVDKQARRRLTACRGRSLRDPGGPPSRHAPGMPPPRLCVSGGVVGRRRIRAGVSTRSRHDGPVSQAVHHRGVLATATAESRPRQRVELSDLLCEVAGGDLLLLAESLPRRPVGPHPWTARCRR